MIQPLVVNFIAIDIIKGDLADTLEIKYSDVS
jgi:hypothetical protein